MIESYPGDWAACAGNGFGRLVVVRDHILSCGLEMCGLPRRKRGFCRHVCSVVCLKHVEGEAVREETESC